MPVDEQGEAKHLWRVHVRTPPGGEAQVFFAWGTEEWVEILRQELKDRGYENIKFTWQRGPYKP